MASLSWSSVSIPVDQVVTILLGGEAQKSTWETIVMDIRLPRVLTATLVGTALGLAGLQMQTVFRNPLASPFTLGVSSGASLGVALVILVSPTSLEVFSGIGGSLFANLGTVTGAALGAAATLSIMLMVASRVGDMVVVLLLGVVMASLIGAIVTILIFFANEQQTREFVEWGLGSFSRVRWGEMPFLSSSIGVAVIMAVLTLKPLNALLLGDNYARSMGLNVTWARVVIMGSASLMAGAVVAYAGPIGFLGIAIPHIARGYSAHPTIESWFPVPYWLESPSLWPAGYSPNSRAAVSIFPSTPRQRCLEGQWPCGYFSRREEASRCEGSSSGRTLSRRRLQGRAN